MKTNSRSIKLATVFCKIVVRANGEDPWIVARPNTNDSMKIVVVQSPNDPWAVR